MFDSIYRMIASVCMWRPFQFNFITAFFPRLSSFLLHSKYNVEYRFKKKHEIQVYEHWKRRWKSTKAAKFLLRCEPLHISYILAIWANQEKYRENNIKLFDAWLFHHFEDEDDCRHILQTAFYISYADRQYLADVLKSISVNNSLKLLNKIVDFVHKVRSDDQYHEMLRESVECIPPETGALLLYLMERDYNENFLTLRDYLSGNYLAKIRDHQSKTRLLVSMDKVPKAVSDQKPSPPQKQEPEKKKARTKKPEVLEEPDETLDDDQEEEPKAEWDEETDDDFYGFGGEDFYSD